MLKYQAKKSPAMSLNGIHKRISDFQKLLPKTIPQTFMEFTGTTSGIIFCLNSSLELFEPNLSKKTIQGFAANSFPGKPVN